MTWLFFIIAFFLIIFLITAVSNMAVMVRLRPKIDKADLSRLSILIPARNEAAVIGRTVRQLLDQSDQPFELILLDDGSNDGTADIAHKAAAGDPRFKTITGEPLPTGWLGKNWACKQLSEHAAPSSQISLFTDADVTWEPGALNALMQEFHRSEATMLSVWPTQTTVTPAEKLVVPLMKFSILSYLPLLGVHYLPITALAAANGQCLLFKRHVYEHIGGHATVADQIIEDVALARAIKMFGFNLRLVDGGRLIGCRMYTSWGDVLAGFGKNILAGHGNSVLFLLFSTLFHWMMFVLPFVWLLISGSLLAAGLVALVLLLRFSIDLFVGVRPGLALVQAILMPVSVGLMTLVAVKGVRWHFGDGPKWKGRNLKDNLNG
ncbi:MAG: chlorobactene glucosyltransferase [Cellvibrionaceae bacterium]|jgi:chlorobactene glucosyltransferase